MIIDSHCHLDYQSLYSQLDQVISRAEINKIKYLLTISTNLDSFEKIKIIIRKYKNIFGTFGIHPHETKNFVNLNIDEIKKFCNNEKKVIGIGETGLDFYYTHSDKEIQKKIFEIHINAAKELNLPVIVHSRSAEKETYEIIKNAKRNGDVKFLIHCFTGSENFAKKLLDLDCYISLSGIITFKNTSNLIDAVNVIPIERLLVETDSPYLAPVPYRGKSNEPSFIKYTVEKLADIKKISIDEVEKNTTENFLRLFNLKKELCELN